MIGWNWERESERQLGVVELKETLNIHLFMDMVSPRDHPSAGWKLFWILLFDLSNLYRRWQSSITVCVWLMTTVTGVYRPDPDLDVADLVLGVFLSMMTWLSWINPCKSVSYAEHKHTCTAYVLSLTECPYSETAICLQRKKQYSYWAVWPD